MTDDIKLSLSPIPVPDADANIASAISYDVVPDAVAIPLPTPDIQLLPSMATVTDAISNVSDVICDDAT